MLTAHLPNDYQGAQTCPRGHCISQQSQCKAANMPSASSGRNPWALWHSAALWMMTRLFILSTATAQLLQGVVLPFGLGKGSTSLHVHKLISLPFSNKTKAFVAGLDNLFIGEPYNATGGERKGNFTPCWNAAVWSRMQQLVHKAQLCRAG